MPTATLWPVKLFLLSHSISPGSAGANQTWNLGAMIPTITVHANMLVASTTPSTGLYPNANINYDDGYVKQFFKTSSTALQSYGKFNHNGALTGTVITTYSDPIDYLHLPCNFNDTYIDSYAGSNYTSPSVTPTYIRFGTTTVTADGYGTLVVPTATYTNVMRVHMHSLNRDSVANSSSGSYYTKDEYFWYSPGTHYPVAGYYNYDGVMHSFYISSNLTGLKENSKQFGVVELYPNPASDVLNIHFPVYSAKGMQLFIYNSIGQEIKALNSETMPTDDIKINTSDLPKGIYILQVKSNGNLLKAKRFVINR